MGGGCYRERGACLCTNTSVCERVYVAECAGWGYAQYKMDPSGQACLDQSLWMEREKGRDDDEGWWRLADGVQRGWSSLLMKSHLRPPFTLNMGRCSCPDLGFDPQRCLTPTISPELPPPSGQHACICIHMCTHPWMHMHTHVCCSIYACTYVHTGMSSRFLASHLRWFAAC